MVSPLFAARCCKVVKWSKRGGANVCWRVASLVGVELSVPLMTSLRAGLDAGASGGAADDLGFSAPALRRRDGGGA